MFVLQVDVTPPSVHNPWTEGGALRSLQTRARIRLCFPAPLRGRPSFPAFRANTEHHELPTRDLEVTALRNMPLAFFDLRVKELIDMAALGTHDVIVRLAIVQFVHNASITDCHARHEARFNKLSKHTVKGRQTHVARVIIQKLVELLRAEMVMGVSVKELQHHRASKRRPQTGTLKNSFDVDGFERR